MDFLEEALRGECLCAGTWRLAASDLFRRNELSAAEWRQAIITSLKSGRAKGNLVCHCGKEGDEGKSFLFGPLKTVFGEQHVYTVTSKTVFPLLGLEEARVVLLDDWRFNETILSYPLQLLWFEGKPIVVTRPQNQYSGHLRYTKDDPIFITTLESDLTVVKKGLQRGDIDMMLKRLQIFRFHAKLDSPDRNIPACARCFAGLLMDDTPAPAAPLPSAKRGAQGHTGLTPERKRIAAAWDIDAVVAYLHRLELGALEARFRENGIDGPFLLELNEKDLRDDLGLSPLQARKVMARLP